MNSQARQSDQRGTAMVMLLLMLLPLAMVFGSFAMTMRGRDSRMVDEIWRERCFWAAEAGLDDAIHRAGAGLLVLDEPQILDLGEGLSAEVLAINIGTDGEDNDGDFLVDDQDPDEDLIEIHSVGRFRDIEREIATWLGRQSLLPPLNGAITISSPTTDIRLTGTPELNGYNYNLDGSLGDPTLSQFGASIMEPSSSADLMSHLSGREPDLVPGPGGSPSLGSGPAFDVEQLAEEVRNSANLVLTNSGYSGYQFGNAELGTGYIAYRDGDVRFSGNTRGAGVLVVTGDLVVTGNFRFDGVIIVLGDFEAGAGTADIYGAVIMGPDAGEVRGTGTFQLRYSDEAIRFTNSLTGRYVTFNGWQELAAN